VRSLLLPERPAIVESILALARTLNTGVVAEGVESEMQAHELKRLGCRHAQGYFFSPPLSSPRVEQMLGARRPLGQKPVEAMPRADVIARGLEPFFGPEIPWPNSDVPAAKPVVLKPVASVTAKLAKAAPASVP
jgi:hypothetical protein